MPARVWSYRGIPIRIRAWTWKHRLCVRVLLLLGFSTWRAYTLARKWFG